MILTSNEFLFSGLPTSSDITDDEIDFAIKTIEQVIVRPRIGNDNYTELLEHPEEHEDILNGGATMAGLKFTECNLVFAYLLVNKYRLTRFASVVKNDEHSTDPDRETLLQAARQYWEIGEICLRDVCEALDTEVDSNHYNSLIFNELYY